MYSRIRKVTFPFAVGIFVGTLFLIAYIFWHKTHDVLTVAFLDVGQGDAIFIESPSGWQVLIDGGPDRDVLSELSRVMPFYDRTIDVVINTHPDKDHIGGLPNVLRAYDVSLVLDPDVSSESATYAYYKDLVVEEKAKYVAAHRGQVIDFGDGSYLRILFPDRDMNGGPTNNASVIVQLVYGETEVILTGDAPKSVESYLVILDGEKLKSDILKAGHHGSKTSSGEVFVHAVSPEYAVISAGKDNSYGHPHKEVIDTLTRASTTILGTHEEGTIVFSSDGKIFLKE
ncbi:MAG: MBL fold metallo-hydrolase [Patescibacteria group bacterium]